ncbi:MAG: hypothetical protein M1817_004229 [Caeruleum heppii]|nr:MAG: hypothetical protein M1817_004229 [Caeruleum heppii]
MPPQRTIPPAKAVKTERTHEENQERAYIAASRRSDRSLEARVESARRASEIHKRRTGRSLRVTEQDVVNEEMYEEEDDDIPVQYRRLTAHLQTGSADFNRRLAAYLTNHVAMRSALDQAITSSYAQQYPNSPQFPQNQQGAFPSPLLPQQMVQNGSIYRQSPYPVSANPQFRPAPHGRAQSIAIPPDAAGSKPLTSPLADVSALDRRMSMPGPAGPNQLGTPRSQPGSAPSAGSPRHSPQAPPQQDMLSQEQSAQRQSMQQAHAMQSAYGMGLMNPDDMGPFSMSLPPESQMMLGPVLNSHDPLTAALMAGSENMPQPFPSFNNDASVPKGAGFYPAYGGMSSTLAPSALDLSPRNNVYSSPSSAASLSAPTTSGFGLDATYTDSFRPPQLTRHSSTQGSGIGDDWGTFIDDNSWEQNVA